MTGKRIFITFLLFFGIFFSGCKEKTTSTDEFMVGELSVMDKAKVKDMIYIEAGEFIMGNDMESTKSKKSDYMLRKPRYKDEHPKRTVYVNAFYIDTFEVTNDQYKQFLDQITYQPVPNHWKEGKIPEGRGKHPVVYVNWFDAIMYTRWLGKRLPTEAEWEKAARGLDGRLWTWGNEFDKTKGNFGLNKYKDSLPVGSFEGDKSPFGLYDVTGNVKEWTQNWYKPYPENDFEFKDFGEKFRVVRGSSHIKYGHYYDPSFAMVTHRFNMDPRYATGDIGMRTVISF